MKKCESCGKIFNESKDVFCPFCGAVATSKQVCGCDDSMDTTRFYRDGEYNNSSKREHDDHNERVYNKTNTAQRQPMTQAYGGQRYQRNAAAGRKASFGGAFAGQRTQRKNNSKVILVCAVLFVVMFMFIMYAAISSMNDFDTSYEENYDDYYDDEYYDDIPVIEIAAADVTFSKSDFKNELLIAMNEVPQASFKLYQNMVKSGFESAYMDLFEYEEGCSFDELVNGYSWCISSEEFNDNTAAFDASYIDTEKILYIDEVSLFTQDYDNYLISLPFDAMMLHDDGTVDLFTLVKEDDAGSKISFIPYNAGPASEVTSETQSETATVEASTEPASEEVPEVVSAEQEQQDA